MKSQHKAPENELHRKLTIDEVYMCSQLEQWILEYRAERENEKANPEDITQPTDSD